MNTIAKLLLTAALIAPLPALANDEPSIGGSLPPAESGVPPPDEAPLPPLHDEAPPPQATLPPPDGWVFAPYTTCVPPDRECLVNVPAAGLNLRTTPNGVPTIALGNGVPLTVYRGEGNWLLVRVQCPLSPTGLWSGTAGISLMACGGA